MPFAYYERLSEADQQTYRQSDSVRAVRLPGPKLLQPLARALATALALEDRVAVECVAQAICAAVTHALGVGPVRVQVLNVRPRRLFDEVYGLYTPDSGEEPLIRVWMRTAQRGQVVAYRTFLRTLLHEVGHHLDVTWLELPRSMHTAGFYGRESSLFHQLVPEARRSAPHQGV